MFSDVPNRIKRVISFSAHVIAGLLVAMIASQAHSATNLSGAESAELQRAISVWLSDDDRDSLPVFANLAARGNVAAALLVARIERTTKFATPWLRSLTRAQRVALYRQPSTYRFSPSWIGWYAYKGNDLAVVFEEAGLSRSDAYLVHALAELGEPQAADTLIRRIAFYGDGQQRAQIAGVNLPLPELEPYIAALDRPAADSRLGLNALVYLVGEEALEDVALPEIDRAASFLHNGMPFETLPSGTPLHSVIARRISETPALTPLFMSCQEICPNDLAQCLVTMVGLHGGYYESIRIDSPLESLISQRRFLASKRARGIALRRAALARDGAATQRASVDAIWTDSQCLAVAVRGIREASGHWFR